MMAKTTKKITKKKPHKKKEFLGRVLSLVDRYFHPYMELSTEAQQEAVREVVKGLAEAGIFVANKSNMPGKMATEIYFKAIDSIDGVTFKPVQFPDVNSYTPISDKPN